MDEFFDPDSWIMQTLSDLADLVIANLLFVLTSVPIITLGASVSALYSVVRTPGERRYSASIFKNYFHAFFHNFKTATLAFLILLIPAVFVACNVGLVLFGLLENSVISYVICGVSILLFAFTWSYTFPLIAHFENSALRSLSNALVLSVAHLPTTVLVTVLNLLPWAILLFFTNFFFKFTMIWVFIAFAVIAKLNMLLLERVFRRYMPESPAET